MELADSGKQQQRYKKIGADEQAPDRLMVDVFVESFDREPEEIWLDLDATDDQLHGNQEQSFYHGYYDGYCYLPLYVNFYIKRYRTRNEATTEINVAEEIIRFADRR